MFGAAHTAAVQNDYGDSTPIVHDTAYTRTMRRAIESLGSPERVAQALGVTVSDIEAWAAGHSNPPPSAFLKAIDIVAQPGNS